MFQNMILLSNNLYLEKTHSVNEYFLNPLSAIHSVQCMGAHMPFVLMLLQRAAVRGLLSLIFLCPTKSANLPYQ